jgi:cysteinyl-tRNA synthetase
MERFYATLKSIKDALAKGGSAKEQDGKGTELIEKMAGLKEKFTEAMDDDFNSARAIGYLFDGVRTINAYIAGQKSAASTAALAGARDILKELGSVFGLFLDDPDDYFLKDRDREARKLGIDIAEVERLIQERNQARADKDWKRADDIRDALAAQKVSIKDSSAGTTWKID